MKLTLIGTSHIAPESLEEVEKTILKKKPGIVAIELDKKRLVALLQKEKQKVRFRDIRRIGFKGWLFANIGAWVEKKLGKKVGVSPGAEMLKGVEIAGKVGARVALIDQDIEITLKRFSKALSWKEKWRFLVDLFNGLVLRRGITFDLAKVPSEKLIKKLLKDVKKRYPNVYRVLVEERNHYMAKKLAKILETYPDEHVIAIIGAGHEEEMRRLVKKLYKPKHTSQ